MMKPSATRLAATGVWYARPERRPRCRTRAKIGFHRRPARGEAHPLVRREKRQRMPPNRGCFAAVFAGRSVTLALRIAADIAGSFFMQLLASRFACLLFLV